MLNELADELENKPLAHGNDIQEWLIEAATMLRQQQAEIAQLKHINKNWQISENILLLELEKLQHRELTNEEITAIWYEPTLRYDPVAFARAILRKAQQ